MRAAAALLPFALLCGAANADFNCPTQLDQLFADMHDGDQKGQMRALASTPQCLHVLHRAVGSDGIYRLVHLSCPPVVKIDGMNVTITSGNPTQTWVVATSMDPETCSAIVDFDVEGKPNPPPVPLTMVVIHAEYSAGAGVWFTFVDPTGTLAEPTYPLNAWVAI